MFSLSPVFVSVVVISCLWSSGAYCQKSEPEEIFGKSGSFYHAITTYAEIYFELIDKKDDWIKIRLDEESSKKFASPEVWLNPQWIIFVEEIEAQYLDKAVSTERIEKTRYQIQDLSAALDLYRLEIGRYPSTEEGLNALIEAPPGVKKWNGPYIKRNPIDPWGREYHYRSPGEHGAFDLYSLGADNAKGGEGENQDITSWEE